MASELASQLAALEDAFHAVYGMRYMTVVGLTCLVWDSLLMFNDEIRSIWKRPFKFSLIKFLFAYHRYLVPISIIFVVYVQTELRPALSDSTCKGYLLFIGLSCIISSAAAQYALLDRVYALWEYLPVVRIALTVGFAVTYGGTFVSAILTLHALYPEMHYNPVVNTCVFNSKPPAFIGIWAGIVCFDIYAMILTVWNAMHRPSRSRQFMTGLQQDGIVLFIALFFMRTVTLVVSIATNAQEIFIVVFFDWAVISAILCRLFISVELIPTHSGSLPIVVTDFVQMRPVSGTLSVDIMK